MAESAPGAQYSLPGQLAESGLLGIHRQESMVDSHHHAETFPGHAVHCMVGLAFTQTKRVYVLYTALQS